MSKYFNRSGEVFIIIFTLFFSILLQIFLIPMLPGKYFYDSNAILSITNVQYSQYFDNSYMFAGNFFKMINIFHLKTFTQWAYFLTIVFSIITFFYLMKFKKIEIHRWIFIYATIIFCNMYIFRISKDAIQLLFWNIMYLIMMSKLKLNYKRIMILSLFIIEAKIFRSYYLYIGVLFLFISVFIKNMRKINIKRFFLYGLIGIIIGLTIVKRFNTLTYNLLINMRTNLNYNRLDSLDAVTAINDLVTGSSVIVYVLNYFLNLFRILFPFELIFKGVKYIPFIIYQLYFSINLIIAMKKNRRKNNLLISILIAYFLVVNLFEPDFGSVIRHEVSLYFIFLELFMQKNKVNIYEENNNHCSNI